LRATLKRTFPGLNNRNSIINLNISIWLVSSGEREEIFPRTARTLLESDREVDKVELIALAEVNWKNQVIYVKIV
jgi:hypothetical protein